MKTISKKIFSVSATILCSFCFGTITRESFFISPEGVPTQGLPTDGAFFSGFVFPFNYQHSKYSYLDDTVAGIMMQFKEKTLPKQGSIQKNKWILRIPTPNFQVHELKGHFNFDIDQDNFLTVELKQLEAINLNNKEICNHSPSLKSIPFFKKIAKIHPVALAKVDLSDNIFEKHIILINPIKKEFYIKNQYLDETGINIQKFKELFYQRRETQGIVDRLPDDLNQYIIGSLEILKRDPVEDNPKYLALKNIDFIYLKYRPGISSNHRRY